MLAIKDTSVVPKPNGWAYYVEPTNFTVTTQNFTQIYPEVVKHCLANGVNPPTEQQVVDQMCERLHIPCYESESGSLITNAWTLNLPIPAPVGCCGK